MWKRAEDVECVVAVRPEKTVAVAEFAFVLHVLVSGASGGVSSGVAYGTLHTVFVDAIRDVSDVLPSLWLLHLGSMAVAEEAATPK